MESNYYDSSQIVIKSAYFYGVIKILQQPLIEYKDD